MNEIRKPNDKDHRQKITKPHIEKAIIMVRSQLFKRLNDKGFGTWLSRHEILGFLTEEYIKVVEATHSKTLHGLKSELVDVAVGCIFAIACIDAGTLDW